MLASVGPSGLALRDANGPVETRTLKLSLVSLGGSAVAAATAVVAACAAGADSPSPSDAAFHVDVEVDDPPCVVGATTKVPTDTGAFTNDSVS